MNTRKSIALLFAILVISVWVIGSAIQAGAETMKARMVITETKNESMPLSDQEGQVLGVRKLEGLAFFENGETAKVKVQSVYDEIMGKTTQSLGYIIYTFDDGSTIVGRFQRLVVSDNSGNLIAKGSGELVKGTRRFEGIKGNTSSTGRNFLPGKDEALRITNDVIFTYTLPPK